MFGKEQEVPRTPLFYKGSWVEDLEETPQPEALRVDYDRARCGLKRAIIALYIVGFVLALSVNAVLAAAERTRRWRITLNVGSCLCPGPDT